MFVRMEQYREAVKTIDMIKAKIAEAENALKKLHDFKDEEEAEMAIWRNTVDELKSRIAAIEKTMIDAGNR